MASGTLVRCEATFSIPNKLVFHLKDTLTLRFANTLIHILRSAAKKPEAQGTNSYFILFEWAYRNPPQKSFG